MELYFVAFDFERLASDVAVAAVAFDIEKLGSAALYLETWPATVAAIDLKRDWLQLLLLLPQDYHWLVVADDAAERFYLTNQQHRVYELKPMAHSSYSPNHDL